jgi:hypothetical protein
MAVQNPYLGGSAALSAVPEAYQPQALENLQQQRMAQLLMQQGQQQPQGQMVSGHYVKASPYQNLAAIANQALGMYAGYQADKGQIDLAKAIREGDRSAMADYLQTKEGRPAEMFAAQAGPMPTGGNIPIQEARAAIPPNAKAAYANLYADPRASTRLQDFAFTKMNEGPMKVGIDDVLLDPNTLKPIYEGAGKDPEKIRSAAIVLGLDSKPRKDWTAQDRAMIDNQIQKTARSGASNISYSAGNKFASGFGEKASARADALYDAAQNAEQNITNAKRTIELVNSGALTGPTADVALTAAKIFNVAGANNQDTITKTEQLFSNRGKAMLGSVKQSGLAGSQGLTEGERKFLTAAEGGTITLNAETLKAMAGLEIKLAVQTQKRWNQLASKMDPEILRATGAGPVEVYTGIGTVDMNNKLLKPNQ